MKSNEELVAVLNAAEVPGTDVVGEQPLCPPPLPCPRLPPAALALASNALHCTLGALATCLKAHAAQILA